MIKKEIALEIKNLNKSFLDENKEAEDILTNFNLQVEKNEFIYTVYMNGEKVLENVESGCPEYDGTLYLGCALNENGVPFRFSEAKILQLSISEK